MKLAKIEAWLIGFIWFIIYHIIPLFTLLIFNIHWHFRDKGHKKYKFLSLKYLNDYYDFIQYAIDEYNKQRIESQEAYDRELEYWRNYK